MVRTGTPSPDISKNAVLAVAALTAFLPPFMLSSVNIALPSIQQAYGASAVWLSWVATSYLLSSAVFLVPAGKMGDIWGRKRILVLERGFSSFQRFFVPWRPPCLFSSFSGRCREREVPSC